MVKFSIYLKRRVFVKTVTRNNSHPQKCYIYVGPLLLNAKILGTQANDEVSGVTNLSEDTLSTEEMARSRSTALPRHQKKERRNK